MSQPSSKQRVVVVLGMHRSGTSLCANLLQVLGVNLGNNLLPGNNCNPEGYWEDAEIARIQEKIQSKLDRQWIGPKGTQPYPPRWWELPELRLLKAELRLIVETNLERHDGFWGFKDPRTSRLLPMWKDIFRWLGVEPLYVLAVRHPLAVTASVVKRDQISPERAQLQWLLHNVDALEETRGELRLVVDYDRWFTHPRDQALAVIAALGLTPPSDEASLIAAVNARVKPELSHHAANNGTCLPWVAETYEALREAAISGQVPERLWQFVGQVRQAQNLLHDWAGASDQVTNSPEVKPRPVIEIKDERFPSLPVPVATAPTRPLRVCIASCEFAGPVRNGGIGTAYTTMAYSLAAAGHEVTLLYTMGQHCENETVEHWEKFYKAKGIRFVPVPGDPDRKIDASWHAIRSYEALQWLRQHEFDIVHFAEWRGHGYYSVLAKHQGLALANTILCVGTHGSTRWLMQANSEHFSHLQELEVDFMERESVRLADVVISPCHYMLNWLKQNTFKLPGRCFVRQYILPVSARHFKPEAVEQLRSVNELVFFGRLETRKGIEMFCDAIDKLQGFTDLPKFKVTFLGKVTTVHGRNSREYIEERARDWPWACEIVSDRDQEGAMRYLQGAGRLAVIPSQMENLPHTVLECLGSNIPFLACRVGGIPELVHPEDVDRVMFPLKVPDFAAKLRQVLLEGARLARPAVDAAENEAAWIAWHTGLVNDRSLARSVPAERCTEMKPLVSVCITHFNRPAYLRQALASIEAQDYPSFEVVIVDDGSTRPDALEYLKSLEPSFQERHWQIVRQENRYLGAARNNAVRHARGQYVVFMDDDNYAKPHELTTLVSVALRTDADIVTASHEYFEGDEPPSPKQEKRTQWLPLGPAPAVGTVRNCYGDANCLMRRDVFLALGGYTELYGVGHEDWEFYAKAVLKGYRLELVSEPLYHYRVSKASMVRTTSRYKNYMRHVHPYLDAVPAPLRDLVLLAQGQALHENDAATGSDGKSAIDTKHVSRLSKLLLDAGKRLTELDQSTQADQFFLEVLRSADKTQNLPLIWESLIDTSRVMIDLGRNEMARPLLQRALKLAEYLHNGPAVQKAKAMIEEAKTRSKRATKTASITPRRRAARVSIIIPTFNRLDLTQKCIAALAQNTSNDTYELIVVDNGSTNDTQKWLREKQSDGSLRTILNAKNCGFARACNQGAKAAAGELLLFLNNDTEVQPGWLDALVATIDSDPSIGAVGSKLLYPDGTIQHAGVVICRDDKLNDPLLPRHVFSGEPADKSDANQAREFQALTAACVLVRKSAFCQAGWFDEAYWNGYEDMDLCFRLREKGWKLVYQPASVVTHHESKSGPERFSKVKQNVQRLHQKWKRKIQPDMIVNRDGSVEITPNSILRKGVVALAAPSQLAADTQTGRLGTADTTPRASITILTYNQLEHTRNCLSSLHAFTPEPHEIIVVDNGSTDGTVDFLEQQEAGHKNLHVILNETNRGFAAGNNQGLAVARGGFVLLLNNDTVVTQGWLGRMLAVFERYPEVGLVGPVSNHVSGPQLVKNVPYENVQQMNEFAAKWAAEHAGQSLEVQRLVGFCLMARREIVERIGGLDERFGSGNFEDDDFCIRTSAAGFRARIALDAFVHHAGSATFKGAKIDYREAMLRNWKLFKKKWSIPADAAIEKGYRLPLTLAKRESLVVPLQPVTSAPETGAATPVKHELPVVAKIGQLDTAREAFGRREFQSAWNRTLEALQARPFHPDAQRLLAKIKKAADKLSGEMPSQPIGPRLSVCLIAKNEEANLNRCLASVKPISHQIIVVDTGSTDRTAEIAKQHGAELYSFTWNDDFSAARNVALEHATGDWVLSLDADEELPATSHAKLLEHLSDEKAMAFRLPLVDHGKEAEGTCYVPRLFRNAPGLFWTGRVHEQVFGSVEALRQEWKLENKLGAATIVHHGYSTDASQQRGKSERNLRLLKLALEEQPNDVNLLMNLGLELTRSGQLDAGIEQYRRAVDALSSQSSMQVSPEVVETLLTQLCAHWMAKHNFAEIVRLLHTPLAQLRPLTASLHFALGLAFMELKRFDEGTEEFRQCLSKRNEPALSPIHKDIRTVAPHHCLALCLWQTGKASEADMAFRAGLAEEPQSRPLRLDLARFIAEHGQPLEALQQINQLMTEEPDDLSVWRAGGQVALSLPEFLEFAGDWTGEAIRHFPNDTMITQQRVDVLLLSGHADQALTLWRQVFSPNRPSDMARLVLCQVLVGETPETIASSLEEVVSQEFVKCLRKLVDAGSEKLVIQVNERLNSLRSTLPTAAKIIEGALAAAETAPSA